MSQAPKRLLKFADHLFLHLDNKTQPMQVIGICVFELPDGVADSAFFAPLINAVKAGELLPTYPFDQKLINKLFWQTDTHLDPANHFFEHQLPDTANSLQDLADLSAILIQEVLPKNRPLWQFHLVTNIAPITAGRPNRFAICLKMHHTITDGIGIMRLLHAGLSPNPNDKLGFPFWQSVGKKPKRPKPPKPPFATLATQLVKQGAKNTLAVGGALYERLTNQSEAFVSPFDTPKSILNQKIDSTRQVIIKTFDKSRFETLAQHFGTSTNNIILAVCASALRAYLHSQDGLPTSPLISLVPISLRRDDSSVGNQLSFLLANLGTDKADPMARLNTIIASINDSKARFDKLTPAQVVAYSAMIYGTMMFNLMAGIAPAKQGFNILISNIPNKNDAHYLNGARLLGIYPASVLFDGQAMNITLSNFPNTLDFGITVCPTVLKNAHTLPRLLEQGLCELENLCHTPTP